MGDTLDIGAPPNFAAMFATPTTPVTVTNAEPVSVVADAKPQVRSNATVTDTIDTIEPPKNAAKRSVESGTTPSRPKGTVSTLRLGGSSASPVVVNEVPTALGDLFVAVPHDASKFSDPLTRHTIRMRPTTPAATQRAVTTIIGDPTRLPRGVRLEALQVGGQALFDIHTNPDGTVSIPDRQAFAVNESEKRALLMSGRLRGPNGEPVKLTRAEADVLLQRFKRMLPDNGPLTAAERAAFKSDFQRRAYVYETNLAQQDADRARSETAQADALRGADRASEGVDPEVRGTALDRAAVRLADASKHELARRHERDATNTDALRQQLDRSARRSS